MYFRSGGVEKGTEKVEIEIPKVGNLIQSFDTNLYP